LPEEPQSIIEVIQLGFKSSIVKANFYTFDMVDLILSIVSIFIALVIIVVIVKNNQKALS